MEDNKILEEFEATIKEIEKEGNKIAYLDSKLKSLRYKLGISENMDPEIKDRLYAGVRYTSNRVDTVMTQLEFICDYFTKFMEALNS